MHVLQKNLFNKTKTRPSAQQKKLAATVVDLIKSSTSTASMQAELAGDGFAPPLPQQQIQQTRQGQEGDVHSILKYMETPFSGQFEMNSAPSTTISSLENNEGHGEFSKSLSKSGSSCLSPTTKTTQLLRSLKLASPLPKTNPQRSSPLSTKTHPALSPTNGHNCGGRSRGLSGSFSFVAPASTNESTTSTVQTSIVTTTVSTTISTIPVTFSKSHSEATLSVVPCPTPVHLTKPEFSLTQPILYAGQTERPKTAESRAWCDLSNVDDTAWSRSPATLCETTRPSTTGGIRKNANTGESVQLGRPIKGAWLNSSCTHRPGSVAPHFTMARCVW
jgi:hypothetical protein